MNLVTYPPIGVTYYFIYDGKIYCGILDSINITSLLGNQEREYIFRTQSGTKILTTDSIYSSASMAATAMLIFAETGELPTSDVQYITYIIAPVPFASPLWFIPSGEHKILRGDVIKFNLKFNQEEILKTYDMVVGSDASFVYPNVSFISDDLLSVAEYLETVINSC